MPDDVPRVDELFSRAVVAQLAEQRAQRETFAEIERRLEGLEHLVAERLSELSKLLRSVEVELRLELLEEELGERFGRLEEAIRADEAGARLAALERAVAERLGQVEESVRAQDFGRRLEALETSLGERFGHLEESVRAEEIGRRLKALELAVDERSSRLEEFVRTGDVEQRLASLEQAVEDRLSELRSSLSGEATDERLEALDHALGHRLTRLEGSVRRLEEQTAARLEDLREASTAAEVGILERIIAESQVVGAHFEAVRPVVEAVAQTGPELEQALAELRKMVASVEGQPDQEGAPAAETTPYAALEHPPEGEEESTVFLPPEETPIPEHRFGGRLPRRER